jgi:hypothetical protein
VNSAQIKKSKNSHNLRLRLKSIERQVIKSNKPEQRLRNEAVTILGRLAELEKYPRK